MHCCNAESPKVRNAAVRQSEPVSLFSERKEEVQEKIDFSKLNITEAVQHGATQRFHQLVEAGVSPKLGGLCVETEEWSIYNADAS